MTKKIIIIVVILAVVILAVRAWNNYQTRQQVAANQQAFAANNTTGTGLLSHLTGIWNARGSSADSGIPESEAESMSKEIANLMELGTEAGTASAQKLKTDLYAGGWSYEGYGKVSRV